MNQPLNQSLNPARPRSFRPQPPLASYLDDCIHAYAPVPDGTVATYIPELSKANPAHFGVSLATIDGHVYESGDSSIPFTIQSISKAFVFALALERLGSERVEAAIGVEPSGEPFNSIHLNNDNRPFNAMVNAGAIACSGLLHREMGDSAFSYILESFGRFAARTLDVDSAVFESERATGDRNRAIAYLLRNYSVVHGDVDRVLDVYFQQCSILVTARDLAIMAATLANRGLNPLTGDQIVSPATVARTLSVMTSSGMYDYAGEWVYRVGIPAKSGVGGGIAAALPSQFGLGTFSPPLDSHGNSVRGIKVCEDISSRYNLHLLNRNNDVRTCVIADYDIQRVASRRSRLPHENQILSERQSEIRVMELVGAFGFATADYVTRRLLQADHPQRFQIIDWRRVPDMTDAASLLLQRCFTTLGNKGTTLVLSGIKKDSRLMTVAQSLIANDDRLRIFELLDDAIEWAEDQLIYRFGGYENAPDKTDLAQHALLDGLPADAIDEIRRRSTLRHYHSGERILAHGQPAHSIFFLQSGMVSIKLPSGVRLATLTQGMEFGEMALIEGPRHADVWADTAVNCLELSLDELHRFRATNPMLGERIALNLARILQRRLVAANNKIDLLTGY